MKDYNETIQSYSRYSHCVHCCVSLLTIYSPALLLCSLVAVARAGLRDEVRTLAGSTVSLSCAVNKPRCGDFHSIKWYKENRRVYVYSPVVDFSKEIVNIITRN